jgi:hypothetical protein
MAVVMLYLPFAGELLPAGPTITSWHSRCQSECLVDIRCRLLSKRYPTCDVLRKSTFR